MAGTIEKASSIVLAKAVKNPSELAGMRACHVRDAAAVCQFLCWLECAVIDPDIMGTLNECSAADRLCQFRRFAHAHCFISLLFRV